MVLWSQGLCFYKLTSPSVNGATSEYSDWQTVSLWDLGSPPDKCLKFKTAAACSAYLRVHLGSLYGNHGQSIWKFSKSGPSQKISQYTWQLVWGICFLHKHWFNGTILKYLKNLNVMMMSVTWNSASRSNWCVTFPFPFPLVAWYYKIPQKKGDKFDVIKTD